MAPRVPPVWRARICAAIFAVAVLNIAVRGLRVTGSVDAGTFYGGARFALTGRNPYDRAAVAAMVREVSLRTGKPLPRPNVFAVPPSGALLLAPVAVLPPDIALTTPALNLLHTAYAVGLIVLLWRLAGPRFSLEARLLAGSLALFLPAVMKTILGQQIGLAALFWLAAGLLLTRSGRWLLAGVCLALALGKTTLTIWFLGALLLRGAWRPVLAAALIFAAVNAAMILPAGPSEVLAAARAELALVSGPNTQNDIMGPNPVVDYGITNARVAFAKALGNRRSLVEAVNLTYGVLISATVAVLIWRRRRPSGELTWSELAAIGAVAMTAPYRRYYDVVALSFGVFALWDSRLRRPGAAPPHWWAMAVALYAFGFACSGVRWSFPFNLVAAATGLGNTQYLSSFAGVAFALSAIWALWREPADAPASASGAASAP